VRGIVKRILEKRKWRVSSNYPESSSSDGRKKSNHPRFHSPKHESTIDQLQKYVNSDRRSIFLYLPSIRKPIKACHFPFPRPAAQRVASCLAFTFHQSRTGQWAHKSNPFQITQTLLASPTPTIRHVLPLQGNTCLVLTKLAEVPS